MQEQIQIEYMAISGKTIYITFYYTGKYYILEEDESKIIIKEYQSGNPVSGLNRPEFITKIFELAENSSKKEYKTTK